ncbi:hypothetical protein IMG5_168350 [Ichthyophthirius multifiliis]|uniref:Uncharacterized protein n=1 Tax=Ichthyophthirius multifiliis TaxID=5932 RepID=G0R132_ICHMU|nr:hypothetical protein IMG5_168350 [Ichthyophthirius multifiliis]EGR28799.1 hypothetical protein IMG5_168350 [Ichthyophthirius multifiliis]|eukprot:XP_004030035.1 hypothetical protein IMG5_168350 [Ichthyophthirius multifiliis]
MNDYKRIAEGLANVNRFNPEIFGQIEHYVLRNLSMEYELKTIVDIVYAFGKGDMGSKIFYEAVQTTIFKGHFLQRSVLFKRNELPYNGYTTSKLLGIFSHAKHRIQDFELEPDFQVFMYNLIMNQQTEYNMIVQFN